jgi:tetratricopeptide (TPR) repeat protein
LNANTGSSAKLIVAKMRNSIPLMFLSALYSILLQGVSPLHETEYVDSAPLSAQLRNEIQKFESMIASDPKNASLRYTAGLLYQLAGRPQEVCDYLYAVYRMDPERASPELFFHLANNLKAVGETEAAVNFYALAIGATPTGPVNWVLMSIALDFLGRPDLALRGYEVKT